MPLKLNGSTSGYVIVDAPAVAGTTTITLPTVSGGSFVVSNSSGNVGIGTTSPSTLLSTSGTITSNVTTGNAAGLIMSVNGTATGFVGSSAYGTTLDSRGATFLSFQTNSSERMLIDSSGNVGIGTSSPAGRLHARFDAGAADGYTGKYIFQTTDQRLTIGTYWEGGVGQYARIQSASASGVVQNLLLNPDGGNLLVGTTGLSNAAKVQIYGGSGSTITSETSGTTATDHVNFRNGNGKIGTITTNGTATSYNTSSDYRLKHSVAPMITGLETVSALKPVTYKWNADDADGEGFIAHELQSVIPLAVTGEKDAVDADGNPIHQGVDYSKIVVHLVAAIQEQQTVIEDLKSRIAVLEAK